VRKSDERAVVGRDDVVGRSGRVALVKRTGFSVRGYFSPRPSLKSGFLGFDAVSS
jgi:hypothetical protein